MIRSTVALLALLAVAMPAARPAAQTDERGRAEALAHRAAERMRALQQEAEELAARERGLLTDLRKLELDRRIHVEELTRVEAESALVAGRLEDTAARVETLERQIAEQRTGIRERLVELYKLGQAGYARLLLGVDDLRSLGRALRTVGAVARLDRERVEAHQRSIAALQAEQWELEARTAELEALRADARLARDEIDRAIRARQALVQSIDEQRDLNAQLAGELQDAQQRLQASLAALALGGEVDPAQITLPLAPFRGELEWPVRGRLAAPFGRLVNDRFGTSVVRNGIEVAAPEGTTVRAIHEGRVAYADPFTGFGNLVIIDHGRGAFSLYGHLENVLVQAETRVDRSAVLGTVGYGLTGTSTLYFELRVDGRPVNPVEWLRP